MIIKVCGMRQRDNVADVAALTPMLMGFIFYRGSSRYVGDLDPDVIKSLPAFVHPVALMVDPTLDEVVAITDRYGFRIVQLHGSESPEFCQALRNRGLVVIKGLPITGAHAMAQASRWDGSVDAFVFDASRGGSGKHFDWQLLDHYHGATPFLLAGGIGPDDVDDIIAAMRPGMIGIDINSRFESAPAIKDINLLTRFILSLRQHNETDTPSTPFWEKN